MNFDTYPLKYWILIEFSYNFPTIDQPILSFLLSYPIERLTNYQINWSQKINFQICFDALLFIVSKDGKKKKEMNTA